MPENSSSEGLLAAYVSYSLRVFYACRWPVHHRQVIPENCLVLGFLGFSLLTVKYLTTILSLCVLHYLPYIYLIGVINLEHAY